ncbi:nuclease-related domain-containing protein [Cryobacterium sp. CG_9.6]|uniref:nuclease-related domain-containing protein n=1 Tax=Cryobacterium sp. CG_9.6 TaxID=2760710 RepID=UPI002476D862|nr:nuclease-related domain-containing protein [Cryobacterium sp. CG_9.6]MDH6237721.1 hypothetical protein [Cryobacterium sp. CG_9.6]
MTVDIPAMRTRLAAHTVIEDLVDQRGATIRSPFDRLLGRSPLQGECLVWYHGAQGDIGLGAALAKLPAGWTVFHSLPVGAVRSEIAHFVVGPGGVFSITTQTPHGKSIWVFKRLLLVAGYPTSYLHDAEYEAERATRVLRKRMPHHGVVRPVIALVDPGEVVIREKPGEVKVLNARHLNSWLLRLPHILNPRELMQIVTLVDDPGTWGAMPQLNSRDVMARFAALEAAMTVSRRRRVSWISAGAAIVLATVGVETLIVVHLVSAMLATVPRPF